LTDFDITFVFSFAVAFIFPDTTACALPLVLLKFQTFSQIALRSQITKAPKMIS